MVQPLGTYRDDYTWIKCTFIVTLGQDFESYVDAIMWSSQDEIYGGGGSPTVPSSIRNAVRVVNGSEGPKPVYFSQKKCRDTSLGGNDAINCYYSYNENDDIIPHMLKTDFGDSGMGRVYDQAFDSRQQIMYLSFGVPEYNSMTSFYGKAVIPKLADLMNRGARFGAREFGYLISSAVTTFFLLPVMPLVFIGKIINKMTSVSITKYYDFRPEMPLYYRMVNTMLIHLAVNMGLAKEGRIDQKISQRTGSNVSAATPQEVISNIQSESSMSGSEGLPDIFRLAGWDIYRILNRKYLYQTGASWPSIEFTDQALMNNYSDAESDPMTNEPVQGDVYASANGGVNVDTTTELRWYEKLWVGFKGQTSDNTLFFGLRVERGVDTTESISNQTGESPVAQALNSKIQAARNIKHGLMHGNVDDGIIGQTIGTITSAISGIIGGIGDAAGLSGPTHLITGAGMIDVPEVWHNSSFSKNYSFKIALRAPYGDPYTIYQSIYIPLSMLLAGGLPRAVGANTYTTPFICRAYCKGMFAVPLGMIESMSITRGGDQHGWNFQRLPTSVDVNFTIKDLSPAMYMGIGVEGGILTDLGNAIDQAFGNTTSFQEYLLTLSGMGLHERLSYAKIIYRAYETLGKMIWNQRLNATAFGMSLANTIPGRLTSIVMPSKLPPG